MWWHPERTLLMVWPPYSTPMATDALRAYGGRTVVYVGEPSGGCTADDAFFALAGIDRWCELHKVDDDCGAGPWAPTRELEIPQWWGLHDRLWVVERR